MAYLEETVRHPIHRAQENPSSSSWPIWLLGFRMWPILPATNHGSTANPDHARTMWIYIEQDSGCARYAGTSLFRCTPMTVTIDITRIQ